MLAALLLAATITAKVPPPVIGCNAEHFVAKAVVASIVGSDEYCRQ